MSEAITTPVGRLVEGSLYKGNEFDIDNKRKVFKSGKNAGQPRTDFYIGLAIPKGKETHWNQTSWGKIIENVGKAAFPKGQWQRPDFSWKITDGDSTDMNRANRRPCDKEGFAGNWILKFSRPFSPKLYNFDGSQQLLDNIVVNLGDYIQVNAVVAGNLSDQQPGVYLNHLMVAFSGYGERINLGPDPESVGFGQDPLPPGASSTPLAAFVPPTAYDADVPMGVAPTPYTPILAVPPSPPVGGPVMLPAANGLMYQQYKDAGWSDQQMIDAGMMRAY